MRNWIIVLLIFVLPLGLYAYLDTRVNVSEEPVNDIYNLYGDDYSEDYVESY